jgi:hypothetical protein
LKTPPCIPIQHSIQLSGFHTGGIEQDPIYWAPLTGPIPEPNVDDLLLPIADEDYDFLPAELANILDLSIWQSEHCDSPNWTVSLKAPGKIFFNRYLTFLNPFPWFEFEDWLFSKLTGNAPPQSISAHNAS